jgi:hypothetical protein
MTHISTVEHESQQMPGVRFRIIRMSLARRIDLTRRVRELARKLGFLKSGTSDDEHIEATLLGQEIDRLYLEWGLINILGLEIDGEAATPEMVVDKGPEELCREMVNAIKAECHLTEQERKN